MQITCYKTLQTLKHYRSISYTNNHCATITVSQKRDQRDLDCELTEKKKKNTHL